MVKRNRKMNAFLLKWKLPSEQTNGVYDGIGYILKLTAPITEDLEHQYIE